LLDTSFVAEDMNIPGLKFHRLKGDLAGFYSVSVSGNWRVIFHFENGQATDVDLIDYH
jgi:proteic killer suppression protein